MPLLWARWRGSSLAPGRVRVHEVRHPEPAAAATFALCLWIALWSIGVKALDGMLLVLAIVVVAAGLRVVAGHLLPSAGKE